jgi:O-antigen ligase
VTASIEQQPNGLLRGSFPLLLIFLFSIFSAAMEIIPGVGKARPQLILAALGLLAVFGTGQFMKVLATPIGKCIAIFTLWFMACIPFGLWPGGSFSILTDQWYKAALIFLLTAGLLTTLPQASQIFRAIAYAIGLLGVLVLLKNDRAGDGRLILKDTRYSNANDLAWTLLVGLAFIGFLYLRGKRWQKIVAVLMVPPILLTLSRTGSRAGAMGAVVLFGVMVSQSNRVTRRRLLAGLPLIFLALVVLLPRDILVRYTTFFGSYDYYRSFSDPTEKLRKGTIESTEARKQLLIDSIFVTLKHPLLGVGPGNFMVEQDVMAHARGDEKGAWKVTHNTYTQLSSEMGLPGLIIYVALLYNVFMVLNPIIRSRNPSPQWVNLRQLATSLRAAFIVYLPVAFFCSLGYNADLPILAGITTALGFMAQKQRAIDRAASIPVVADEPLLEPGLEPVAVGRY